jgi:hypothetical protein
MLKDADRITVMRTIAEGKSKYTLNGRTETSEKIKSIFMGV